MSYILIFILFTFISLITEDTNFKKNYKTFLILTGEFIFLFISAFRYKTGMDWYNYLFEYNNLKTVNKVFSSFGYIFIEKIGNFFKIEYFTFQAIISLFAGIVIIIFYQKNSKYFWSSITIYYLLFYLDYNMALQKQLLAITFSILAFDSLEKSKIKYFIYSLISLFFHFSAVVFILGTFITYFLKKINYKILINTSFIVFLILLKVDILKIIFDLIIYLKLPILSQRIAAYSSIEYYSRAVNPSLLLTFYYILEFSLAYFIFIKRRPESKKDIFIYSYTLLYLLFKILSIKMYILYRLISYFGIFYCIFLTNFLDIIKKKEIKIIAKFSLYLFIGASFFSVMTTQTERRHKQYNPYYSIFKRVDTLERLKAELGNRFCEEEKK